MNSPISDSCDQKRKDQMIHISPRINHNKSSVLLLMLRSRWRLTALGGMLVFLIASYVLLTSHSFSSSYKDALPQQNSQTSNNLWPIDDKNKVEISAPAPPPGVPQRALSLPAFETSQATADEGSKAQTPQISQVPAPQDLQALAPQDLQASITRGSQAQISGLQGSEAAITQGSKAQASQIFQVPALKDLQLPESQNLQAPNTQNSQVPGPQYSQAQDLQTQAPQNLQAPTPQNLQPSVSQDFKAPTSQDSVVSAHQNLKTSAPHDLISPTPQNSLAQASSDLPDDPKIVLPETENQYNSSDFKQRDDTKPEPNPTNITKSLKLWPLQKNITETQNTDNKNSSQKIDQVYNRSNLIQTNVISENGTLDLAERNNTQNGTVNLTVIEESKDINNATVLEGIVPGDGGAKRAKYSKKKYINKDDDKTGIKYDKHISQDSKVLQVENASDSNSVKYMDHPKYLSIKKAKKSVANNYVQYSEDIQDLNKENSEILMKPRKKKVEKDIDHFRQLKMPEFVQDYKPRQNENNIQDVLLGRKLANENVPREIEPKSESDTRPETKPKSDSFQMRDVIKFNEQQNLNAPTQDSSIIIPAPSSPRKL